MDKLYKKIYYNPAHIKYVEQTPELCKLAISRNPYAIKYIENQTEELCLLALKKDKRLIKFVKIDLDKNKINDIVNVQKQHLKNVSDVLILVETNPILIRNVDNPSHELCEKIININPYFFKFVKQQTKELCIIALNKNFRSIKYIHTPTLEICKYAIDIHFSAIHYLKNQSLTICLYAIKQNPLSILYINKLNYYLCRIAIKEKPNIVIYLEKKLREQLPEYYDLLLILACERDERIFPIIQKKTKGICEWIIENQASNFSLIPSEHLTKELVLYGLNKNKSANFYIPSEFFNDTVFCYELISLNGINLRLFPKNTITEDIVKRAMNNNNSAFIYIPKELRTNEIVRSVLKTHPIHFNDLQNPEYDEVVEYGYITPKILSNYKFTELQKYNFLLKNYKCIEYLQDITIFDLMLVYKQIIIQCAWYSERELSFLVKLLEITKSMNLVDEFYFYYLYIENFLHETLFCELSPKLNDLLIIYKSKYIKYVINPSKILATYCVYNNPNNIVNIKNASDDMWNIALSKQYKLIQHIDKPTYEQCIIVFNNAKMYGLVHIKTMPEEFSLFLIKNDKRYLSYIRPLTTNVILHLLKIDPLILKEKINILEPEQITLFLQEEINVFLNLSLANQELYFDKVLSLVKKNNKIIDEEKKHCLICYSDSEFLLKCSHSFCKECLFDLCKTKKCSYCQIALNLNFIYSTEVE